MSKTVFQETLIAVVERMLGQIHTAMPGQVEKYDHETGKTIVKPMLKRKYMDGQIVSLPLIVNCPVMFPRTARFAMTFPLEKGDRVLILFSERALELYLKMGEETIPGDRRKFDLSDGIIFPGLYPFSTDESQEPKPDNNEDFLIQFNEAKLRITSGGDLRFSGDIIVEGDVKAGVTVNEEGEDEGGISLTEHTHSGVSSGPEDTGPPNET